MAHVPLSKTIWPDTLAAIGDLQERPSSGHCTSQLALDDEANSVRLAKRRKGEVPPSEP